MRRVFEVFDQAGSGGVVGQVLDALTGDRAHAGQLRHRRGAVQLQAAQEAPEPAAPGGRGGGNNNPSNTVVVSSSVAMS